MHLLTGNLTFYKENDIKRMKKIKSLKGMRHQKGLPVRGQRTKSHFRKNKGKVVGVAKESSSCRRRRKERSKEIGKSWEIQKQLRKV